MDAYIHIYTSNINYQSKHVNTNHNKRKNKASYMNMTLMHYICI